MTTQIKEVGCSQETPLSLPSYEETLVQYSLRLPTYRSGYVHRYHPYTRCDAPQTEEDLLEGEDIDEASLTDMLPLDSASQPSPTADTVDDTGTET
ncbi:hypothetical protein AMATHDRAFT_2043 [Amanita thiersii Skay4041]|uniref:Uncharacterized protein n=1 Tax=Amanita thiersii Skay4041 TaxID=703135 RepID=A0A2A9NWF4_9AGAR|nr:hypothetical protein AMATHDRAFT_2043 [Amanita thiersii Skay4041]